MCLWSNVFGKSARMEDFMDSLENIKDDKLKKILSMVCERYPDYRRNSESIKGLLINEKKLEDLIGSKENVTYDMDKIKKVVEKLKKGDYHTSSSNLFSNTLFDMTFDMTFADYFVGKKSALQVNDEKYNAYFTYLACISILDNIEFNNASLSWKLRIAKEKRKFEKK